MKASETARWCGLSLLAAGLLAIVFMLLHPNEVADPNALANPLWGPVHLGLGLAFLLTMFGLIGLHSVQGGKAGMLGLLATILSIASTALLAGVILFFEGAVMPVLATSSAAAELLSPSGPLLAGLAGALLQSLFILTAFAFLLLGYVTYRAKVLPKWAGILLMAMAPAVFAPPLPFEAALTGVVLFGLGCMWLGYAMWIGKK
ncbi:MAG: hypothetical protein HY519_04130 [Candidatus Aenigmarchaeota archaeon]|nr:hypothetical protein [Candidatus Aenigmarchaeota archaeon]